MRVSNHETWALIHGVAIGGLFLLGFTGGLAALWSLRSDLLTTAGVAQQVKRLRLGTALMAVMAWATVLTGAWIILPWYRAAGGAKAQLMAETKQRCPVLINWSTGGAGPMSERIHHLAQKPHIAALNMGSMNYAKWSGEKKQFAFNFVFSNSFDDIVTFARTMKEHGIKPVSAVRSMKSLRVSGSPPK